MLAEFTSTEREASDPFAAFAHALGCLVESEQNAALADGPLAGLIYLAKDMFARAGRAATCGLPTSEGATPDRDAAILVQLDDAGAQRRGFAEMTALACEPSGSNPGRRRPLNPWNALRICGGSSSGPAVAVAAGLVDFAIGSDTAGSLRIPAQCCGVTAWKPTPGLVPLEGSMALAPSLDVIGFLAQDAATLARVASLFAPSVPKPVRRIARADDLFAQCHRDIPAACSALAESLAAQGCAIDSEPFAPLLAACDAAVLDLLQFDTAQQHGWRLETGRLDATLQARLRKGLAIAPERAQAAGEKLRAIAGALTLFRHHDAILLPVMPIQTPPVAQCEPASPDFSARTLYALSAFTRFVNGLRLPVVALPCGFDGNAMPVAAQLVGPPGSDLALLSLAAKVQAASDWHGRDPSGLAAIRNAAR